MPSIPLYRAETLRRIEAAAANLPLMQRAGRAAASLAITLSDNRSGPILVLAGPGNNGGDAFEVALQLREQEYEVRVVFLGNTDRLPKDAAAAYQRFVTAGGETCPTTQEGRRWSMIVDGLFGIGLTRAIEEPYAGLIRTANALAAHEACPLLALDCPSGLDSDTGKTMGETIRATHTLTFIGHKPGLLTADGPDHCGEVKVATLDLDAGTSAINEDAGLTVAPDLFSQLLRPRRENSHKGSFGNAGILGGTRSMVGAALLAGRAALRLGSGRVYVGLLDEYAPALDILQPELMMRSPGKLLTTDLTALACGPGMGCSHEAGVILDSVLSLRLPLVLDADALNLVAGEGDLHVALATRKPPTLITPHPAEAARLLDSTIAAVQSDRIGAALELASIFNAYVALKGCGTIIATPDGQWFVNPSGNPGLATAGSGDVLTGFVIALLAQHWPPLEALLAAVHLHGCAADMLVAQGCGPIGMTAGELIDSARACFNRWTGARH